MNGITPISKRASLFSRRYPDRRWAAEQFAVSRHVIYKWRTGRTRIPDWAFLIMLAEYRRNASHMAVIYPERYTNLYQGSWGSELTPSWPMCRFTQSG